MRQLNEKEIKSHSDNSHKLAKRKIFSDQLNKMDEMKQELIKKDKLISDLQTLVNSGSSDTKSKRVHSPVSLVSLKIIII